MSITVQCESCFYSFGVAEKHAGRTCKCPECGEPVKIAGEPEPSSRQPQRSSHSRTEDDDAGRSSRPKRSRGKKKSSSQTMFIGIGGAVAVLVIAVVLFSGGEPAPPVVDPVPQPPAPMPQAATAPAIPQPAAQPSSPIVADVRPVSTTPIVPENSLPPADAGPKTLASLQRLTGHPSDVRSVAFSPDGQFVVTGGEDGVIRVFNLRDGTFVRETPPQGHRIDDLAFLSGGTAFLAVAGDKTARWSINGATTPDWAFSCHSRSVAVSADGRIGVMGQANIFVVDLNTGVEIRHMPVSGEDVWGLALSADGLWALSGGNQGVVRLWDVTTGNLAREFTGHSGRIHAVAFLEEQNQIVSGGEDGTLRVWDAASGREVRSISTSGVLDLQALAGGTHVVAGHVDGVARVYDVARGTEAAVGRGQSEQIWSVSLAPDQTLFASASGDGTVQIWDYAGNGSTAVASAAPIRVTTTSTISPGAGPKPTIALPKKSLADLVEDIEPSVVRVDVTTDDGEGTGSGFIVDGSGLIVTNYHVIEGGTAAKAVFSDGGIADVTGFVKLVPEKDIAILKIDYPGDKLKPLKLAGDLPRKGESVLACGAPLGLSFTFSEGIISAHREAEEIFGKDRRGTWMQTTTPISPGNSGGPLVNMQAEVVAINTVTVSGAQNLNFGISCQDIALALRDRAQDVTALSPTSVPVRGASSSPLGGDGDRGLVDVTGDDRGKMLLGQMTEMTVIALGLDFDAEGELTAYLRRQAELQSRQLGIEVNNSEKALLFVTMEFPLAGTGNRARVVKITAQILVREGGSVYKVWDAFEELGSISGADFARGKVPTRLQSKTVGFFKRKFGGDYKEAQEFAKSQTKAE